MSASLQTQFVKGRWLIKKKVGKGTFCEMHLGRTIIPFDRKDAQVAIKIQSTDIEKNILRSECEVLKALSGLTTVPRFIYSGKHEKKDIMVMELLSGEDMAHLRDRIRSKTGMRLIALPGAIYLAQQILTCVRGIHEMGYIHRDIKPANFIRRHAQSTEFVMVDFGIAKLYKDIHGELRPKRENCDFRGTAQYASPFAHEGADQCPRDDLLGLVLVFFDLVCGKLPWLESVKAKDKIAVTESKKKFFADAKLLCGYVHEIAASEMQKAPADITKFDNFPNSAQHYSCMMIDYLMKLKYEDVPDYNMLHSWFSSMLPAEDAFDPANNQISHLSAIQQFNYNFRGFNWQGGLDKRMDEKEPLSSDPAVRQEICVLRMKHLSEVLTKHKKKMQNSNEHMLGNDISENQGERERKRVRNEPTKDVDAGSQEGQSSEGLDPNPLVSDPITISTPSSSLISSHNNIGNESSSVPLSRRASHDGWTDAPDESTRSNFISPKRPHSLDLLYDFNTISPHEAVRTLWSDIVNELKELKHLLKVETMTDIFKIAEKHAFFQDLYPIHADDPDSFALTGGVYGPLSDIQQKADIVWGQICGIQTATKRFLELQAEIRRAAMKTSK